MKVLITGSDGFIGYNLCKYFYEKKYEVIGIDQKIKKEKWKNFKIDLCDDIDVIKILNNIKPDVIIHCAGLANIHDSLINPTLSYSSNVFTTHNILFGLKRLNLLNTKVIYLSSGSVYGNSEEIVHEDSTLHPLSPYALHKMLGENICTYMVNNFNMKINILRIFSVYGRGLKKQLFWDLYLTYKDKKKLILKSNGLDTRDFIHINDLVKVIDLILNTENSDLIYNVGNNDEILVKDAVNIFAFLLNVKSDDIIFNESNHCIQKKCIVDINKIKKLGYKKSVTLEDGLKDYVNWLKNLE